ncbi:MAG: glycosyltransferase family 1 protein [Bacteroidetes bacterium]|nr:glycosyltransferase family 1 protein [Bacteroidota bacterium]
MKIGIEGQRLFRKKKHGMDMVALELINNLQEIDHENEYMVYVSPDEDKTALRETPNFRIVELTGGFYPLWEQIALPRAAKNDGCEILHCTSNTAPVNTAIPLVVTLHDIIYMESSYPKILSGSGTTYQKFGNVYRRIVVPRVIKKSKAIITVSHFEKNRIGEFFGMQGDPRLTAVYNGVSDHFKPVSDPSELHRVKEKYHLPGHFFFFLGNTDPKKNTKGTLKAYADFIKLTGADIQLVMLDYDRAELDRILEEIGDNSLINRIILTGYVINTDLPAIYSLCEVFLYPSLRESFGIPMLEAMACGGPVITSNTSSMPEIAGLAAFIVDPYKPEEITQAMIRLTEEKLLKDDLVQKGFIQAAKFSWRAMAENVLEIYREVYSTLK